jgi:signal transduction histidine kinase
MDVPIVQFTPFMLLELFLPLFLFGLGLLAIGIVVYKADSSEEINLIFTLFVTIAAGFAMDWIYVPRISDRLADALAVTLILNVPWIPLFGAVLFHWIGLLTEPGFLQSFVRRARLPYYAVSAPFSLVGVVVYLTDYSQIDYRFTPVFYLFIMVSSVFSFCWGILSMGWTFRQATSKRIRRQSGLILMGLVTGLAVVLPLIFLFTGATAPRYIHTIPFFGLAVVAFFGYAILRYQLFSSKARVLNTLLVAIFCILVANLIYLTMGRLTGFLPILVAALVAGVGLVTRQGPTSFFTRFLRRETLDYQTVARFSRRVGGLQQIESLLQAAFQVLHQNLDVEHIDVWLLNQEHKAIERFHDGQPAGSLPVPAALIGQLLAHPEPIHASESASYGDMLGDPESSPVVVWVPLVDRGQAVGLLALGPRWTGEVYDDQDLQLVGILARQMALSILNARQFERLQATSRLILQAQENERLKIARELHDSILQFLLVLTYGLDGLKEQGGAVTAEIERWQDRISLESDRLRGMLSYLRAPEVLVQQGLVSALETWIEQVSLGINVSIQTELEPKAESALPVEAQVAIYRVFREAIYNALKHAGCEKIVVQLHLDSSHVRFSIEDDGQGFDVARAIDGKGKGYSSLQDMQTYVENVGGDLVINSAPDQGTVVSGQIRKQVHVLC